MDTPYRIEPVKTQHETVYDIYRTGEDRVCRVYSMYYARRIVDALNDQELKRLMQRVA